MASGGSRIEYHSPSFFLVYKRLCDNMKGEDIDFKDYTEELIGEEKIYPYSVGTK